ncbi:hypothetical protein AX774_g2828 [Zancudomyces culisetae]|uniref:Uncharacterized protein n=1 Tax=Zancudomyces culisetae TaxID=1213189 RepID=A0A1R1PF69_ZANCU|nr:hypothetical protein AX774_g7071 [Zancudomyces culisetae]OMH83667.1 hypothetical protein AX774_g2828 [Zancudomyces culisetae]|eukprot:OMH79512.1 hypothetical protein AX774_g7071 [Zancudomyces culisetae]
MLQQNASNYDKVSVSIEEEMSTGPKRRGGASPAINSKGEIKYQFMEDELGIGAGRGGQQAGVGLADTEYLGEDESIFAEHKNTRFFDWFYSMNLGTQLLIEDQLSVRTNNQSYVKKIHPTKVLQNAVETAREVARRQYK